MEQRKGFRAFVQRHDALFTTAGALIVFVGFFMKEGVRETTKDLSGSIATANKFYSIHDALNNIAESEFGIANTVRDINHVIAADQSSDVFAKENSLVSLAPAYSAMLDLERHKFLVSAELLDELPAKPFSLEEQRRELSEALIDDKDVTGLKEAISRYFAANVAGDSGNKERMEEEKGRVRSLTVHAVTVVLATSSKLKAFTSDVSDEAVRQKEEQERKLKSATYTTYGLFTLGWGLGLIGKVLKLPALGGGE
jgi:hypothetical protein